MTLLAGALVIGRLVISEICHGRFLRRQTQDGLVAFC
jgi:hypothetical protein